MGSVYFIAQEATPELLLGVSNMCAECYSEIKIGDTIHYDRIEYRYLCKICEENIRIEMNKNSENTNEEEQGAMLF